MSILSQLMIGIRRLARDPLFSLFAVISLAFAIGVGCTVFSLVDALFIRTLAVSNPEKLVALSTAPQEQPEAGLLSLESFHLLQETISSLLSPFGWDEPPLRTMKARGSTFAGGVVEVSSNFFSVLGVKPALGRLLQPFDFGNSVTDRQRVAVLSFAAWETRYALDPHVLGDVLWADGTPLVIVGVAPKDFAGIDIDLAMDAFVPFGAVGGVVPKYVNAGARIRSAMSAKSAEVYLSSIWPSVLSASVPSLSTTSQREKLRSSRLYVWSLETGSSQLRDQLRESLVRLLALSALALIVAWVNLAALTLARSAISAPELAIRAALGSSRAALVRSALIESGVIAVTGTACGTLVVPWLGLKLLKAMLIWQPYLTIAIRPSVDFRVLLLAFILGIVTACVCAVAPITQIFGANLLTSLSAHAQGFGKLKIRYFRALQVSQISLALVFLVTSMVLARSFINIVKRDVGFDRNHVLTIALLPKRTHLQLANASAYYADMIGGLIRLPGVKAGCLAQPEPLLGVDFQSKVSAIGSPVIANAVRSWVSPAFFGTLGVNLLQGRDFNWNDDLGTPPVAIISDSLSQRLFLGANAVGRTITIQGDSDNRRLEIVGVVSSPSLWRLQSVRPEAVYTSITQTRTVSEPQLLLRITDDSSNIRRRVASYLETNEQHYAARIITLNEKTELILSSELLLAEVATGAASFTIVLALGGLYGLVSYIVARRNREIGIRMAMGAQRVQVLMLFVKEAAWLAATALSLGIPASVAVMHLTQSILFQVPPIDIHDIALSSFIILLFVIAAAFIPARRASLADPVKALRDE